MMAFCRTLRPSVKRHSSSSGLKTGLFTPSKHGLPPLDARKDLLWRGYGKGEDNLRQAILEFGIGVFDVRLGFFQLPLCEFDDRAETQIISGLSQTHRKVCLLAELLRDREPLKRSVGVFPGIANVTGDVVARI